MKVNGCLRFSKVPLCTVLLCAHILSVNCSVLSTIQPRSSADADVPAYQNTLGRDASDQYCGLTPLAVNNEEYEKRCGANSDPKWPCFTHYAGNLDYVTISPWLEPLDMTHETLLKDDQALGKYQAWYICESLNTTDAFCCTPTTDFTMRNASDAFVIDYLAYEGVKLRYYGYEPDTGCYKIHLSGNRRRRIWVSDDDGDGGEKDIDTRFYSEAGKRLCTKWAHIHLGKNDNYVRKHMRDSDGHGI